jgi:hypothetical protein
MMINFQNLNIKNILPTKLLTGKKVRENENKILMRLTFPLLLIKYTQTISPMLLFFPGSYRITLRKKRKEALTKTQV